MHGVSDVERALRCAAEAHGGTVRAIHRAFRAEAHRIGRRPEELPVLLYNHLRNEGWASGEIERELRFPGGLPMLRLRHPTERNLAELTFVGHRAGIWSCAFSPNGRRLVSASRDTTVHVWDTASGERIAVLRDESVGRADPRSPEAPDEGLDEFTGEARDAVVTPDGRRVVSAHGDGKLRIWEIESGRLLGRLAGHESRVLACAVSADGRRILSASSDGTLRVWDAETGASLLVLSGHTSAVRDCAILPDGERCISVSYDGSLRLWSLSTGEQLASVLGGGRRCALSPDGAHAVVVADSIELRDLTTLELLASFGGHERPMACAVLPDGKRAVSSGMDHSLRVWQLATGKEIASTSVARLGQVDITLDCAFIRDGRHLVSASWDGTLRMIGVDALLGSDDTAPRQRPRDLWSEHVITRDGERIMRSAARRSTC